MKDLVLAEAKRLHKLGAAILWLHPKSKRPIESKWTDGPRADWGYLQETYMKGLNVGVRLGTPSMIAKRYLAVIDVDVKSKDPKHLAEVNEKLKELIGGVDLPQVLSGRGNGSRHYYLLTKEPMKPFLAARSKDLVKVEMGHAKPSKKDLEHLTPEEIKAGIRLRPAWEIGVMGDGQQVVLPPSVHPISGKEYRWANPFDKRALADIDLKPLTKPVDDTPPPKEKGKVEGVTESAGFTAVNVDVQGLPISKQMKAMIIDGTGVEDRSAMLLPAASALLKAGLKRDEILSVLTDPTLYLGACAYDHAKTKDRTRAAKWVWTYTLKKVMAESSAEAMFREPIEEPKVISFDEMLKDDEGEKKIRHWTDDLEITKDDKYRTTLKNTVMILEHAVEGAPDLIKRDLFAYRDFYSVSAPWGGKKNEALTDDDLSKIKHWIGGHFGMEPSANTIGEALTILATRNSFDPVVDWLRALPKWDEKPRLDSWLKNHFNGKGSDEYLAQVFRKWMVAMVMRILKPGAKFDWMPIFEGAQGVGKSSFGRLLVGEKYFLDWLPDLSNKDSALALQGVWSVEMGELSQFRKMQMEIIKAFITRTIDKIRPPYGQRWIESPRRCVFFGTTNFEQYLRDTSGNRRFKPVEVGGLDFVQLEADRDQLYAEALWLWDHGFETEKTLELDGEARIFELQIQGEKMVEDDADLMFECLTFFIESELKKPAEERFDFKRFKMQDLFGGTFALGGIGPLKNWQYSNKNAQSAGRALRKLGGENNKKHGNFYWNLPIDEMGDRF